jgi:PPM family protein phosphatase
LPRRESPFHLEIAGATHIGGRRANEDAYCYDENLGLFAVADGVSYLPAGRIAAEVAIDALFNYMSDANITKPADARERIERAFGHVHHRVREKAAAEDDLRGMATTLACAMERGTLLLVGHVGDSRVIRFREDRLERLTTDHRLASDPLMRTRLTPEVLQMTEPDALTRAIGRGETVAVEVSVEAIRADDGVLLTTDGLTAVVDDSTIVATIQRCRTPLAIVDALIQCALERNAPDNVTCIYGHWRSILA